MNTMETIIIIFIFTKLYDFMNYRFIAKVTQDMGIALDELREDPEETAFFVVEKSPAILILSFIADICFLIFCIYLMFNEETWTPGVLLLIISALESYALYAKIDGTCFLDSDGYYYPTIVWRYATTASSLFILTRLLQFEKLLEGVQ